MTNDEISKNLIRKASIPSLAIGYNYSESVEDQEERDMIKGELIKRLGKYHSLAFLCLCLFANLFFCIAFLPIQEGPLEIEKGHIPRGVSMSIIVYTILFLVIGLFLNQSNTLYFINYVAILGLGFILYKTVKSFIRYIR